MGKKKGRTFKVQKAPPHKGAVILTGKPWLMLAMSMPLPAEWRELARMGRRRPL